MNIMECSLHDDLNDEVDLEQVNLQFYEYFSSDVIPNESIHMYEKCPSNYNEVDIGDNTLSTSVFMNKLNDFNSEETLTNEGNLNLEPEEMYDSSSLSAMNRDAALFLHSLHESYEGLHKSYEGLLNYEQVDIVDETLTKSCITKLNGFNHVEDIATNKANVNNNTNSGGLYFKTGSIYNRSSLPTLNREGLSYSDESYYPLTDSYNFFSELYSTEIEPEASFESLNRRRLRSAFEKWKIKFRLKMLDKEPADQFLTREYYRSKAEYQLQQKNCIASVHFKISILSESFHKWRLYTISMNVKRRMLDVASVHYADHISYHSFMLWKHSFKERCIQEKKVNMFIMGKTFQLWKNRTQLLKEMDEQRHCTAVEGNNQFILRYSYNRWKEHFMMKKADSCHQLHQKRHIFTLWSLQLLKRKLQRRLARSHHRKICQKKCFVKWWSGVEEKAGKRLLFMRKIEIFMMRLYWQSWKSYVENAAHMKSTSASVNTICRQNTLHHFYFLWKHQYSIECFKENYQKHNAEYILRVHFEKWAMRRKKILLLRNVKVWNGIQRKLMLLLFFRRWQHQRQKMEENNLVFQETLVIIQQNRLARTFSAWVHQSHNGRLVKAFTEAREIKKMARCFQLWISFTRHVIFVKMQNLNIMRNTFLYWREVTESRRNERTSKIDRNNKILERCVAHWKEYASMFKQRRETCVTCFARHWLDVTQQRVMNRKILQAEKVSNEIIKKVHFVKWQHQLDAAVRRRGKMEELADEHRHCTIYSNVVNRWIRQQNITIAVRNFQEEKEKELLSRTFKHWLEMNREDMQILLNSFTAKLIITSGSPPSTLSANQQCLSPQFSMVMKSNETLFSRYKNSINNTLQQQNDNLQLQNDSLEIQTKTVSGDNMFGSTSSLLQHKTEQSDIFETNTSLIFSTSDIPDFSSNPDLLDYNTDNDVDQDQIWEEPTSRSEFQLNLSSLHTTISEDHFIHGNNFSLASSLNNTLYNSASFPKWIYLWKKRYTHSRMLSQQSRYIHDDVVTPHTRSLLLSFSAMSPDDENIQLSASFTDGDNVPKENIDKRKVTLLVATLKYWKHLDVSGFFYAWLEYTQRKKYLRLLQDYLIEKKNRYQMHVVFLQWNRKLYGIHASLYFRQRTLLNQYFYQLKKYHSYKQVKLARLHRAAEYHRKSVHRSCFKEWKKKCYLELLLSGINCSGHGNSEMLLNKFTAVREKRNLTSLFQSWKESTAEMKFAKEHYSKMLQVKYLNMWWRSILMKGHQKARLKKFHRDHQLKTAFLLWRRKRHCQIQVHKVESTKETELKKLVFSEWNKWTKSKVKDKLKGSVFTYKCNYQLAQDAFREWKVHHKQITYAITYHKYVLLTKVFSSWHGTIGQKASHEKKVISFQNKSSSHLILQSFSWWKQLHESRLNIKHSNREKEEITLSITFKAWKKRTWHSKADKQYIDSKYKYMFKSWKEKYVSHNEIQFFTKITCRRWKRLVERSRSYESILQEYLEEKYAAKKKAYFLSWKQILQTLTISKRHSKKKLLTCMFSAWKGFRYYQVMEHQSTKCIAETRTRNVVSAAFRLWQKHCTRKKALANIKERLTMIMVKEKAVHWKLKTKKHIYSCRNDKDLLKKYLMEWSRCFQHIQKAIYLDERNKKRRCINRWISHSRRLKELKLVVDCYIRMKEDHMVKLLFVRWRDYKDYSIEVHKHWEVQFLVASKHHNLYLQKMAFYKWRLHMNGEKVKKVRHERIARKYFDRWRSNVVAGNFIISLLQQRKCELFWTKWRNAYIEQTILKEMKKRDERKVIAVVFSSWKRYTRLKHSLPQEVRMLQSAIWFRKWRNRCYTMSS